MPRRRPANGTRQQPTLRTVHPHAAGMDIGSRLHVVAVPPDRSPEPVRTFERLTAALHRRGDG
jgi:transposase